MAVRPCAHRRRARPALPSFRHRPARDFGRGLTSFRGADFASGCRTSTLGRILRRAERPRGAGAFEASPPARQALAGVVGLLAPVVSTRTGWAVAAKDSFQAAGSAAVPPTTARPLSPGDTEFGQAGALLPAVVLVAIYLAFSDR